MRVILVNHSAYPFHSYGCIEKRVQRAFQELIEGDSLGNKYNYGYFWSQGLLLKGTLTLNHFLVRYLKPKDNNATVLPRLLDFGCDLGRLLQKVEPYYEAFGIDISEWAVEYCKSILRSARVTQGDMTNLSSFPDYFFDFIFAGDSLEHLATKQLVDVCLQECRRCLKKDGLLFVTTPNLLSPLIKLKQSKWYGFTDVTHVSPLKRYEWTLVSAEKGRKDVA